MSAGTLSIQNNTAAVAGDGTAFATELSAGDFIAITTGGVTYTLPVKTIESDTALTLSRNYSGPAVTGAAWAAMPRDTLNRISAQIAADTSYIVRQRVLEVDNWYQLLEVNGDVTIRMADGSSYTGPSWLKLIDIMKEMQIDQIIPIAAQIRADAQQVADDKPVIIQAKDDAEAAAAAAASSESNAATSETNAAASKDTAAQKAEEAAESARQAAESNPQLALQKSLNLSDVPDKQEARQNLEVYSKADIKDLLPGWLGQREWQELRSQLEPGTVPLDGQVNSATGMYAALYAKGVAGKLATTDEATWRADPTKRNCYVINTTAKTIRLPDMNGVSSGSVQRLAMIGDGGDDTKSGTIQRSGLPNVKGETYGYSLLGGVGSDVVSNPGGINTSATNPLNVKRTSNSNNYGGTAGDANWGSSLSLNLNRGSSVYKDGVTDVQVPAAIGCWTVRIATVATNGGSIDALQLAAEIAAGDAINGSAITMLQNRIGYALLDFGTMAIAQRKVIANPLGNNTPVIVAAEVQRTNSAGALVWGETGWIYSTGDTFGVKAGYASGEGVVVQVGSKEMSNTNANTGSPILSSVGTGTASLPVRVHVWKVTA